MIKVEKIDAWGFEHAIRGMRNPMNSWNRSDSRRHAHPPNDWIVGPNDLDLMRRLYKAGHPHRKYLRQIMVSMDITAPLYWWKEFDTYKVGTTANSCSTMHKITAKEFELDDFSWEHLSQLGIDCLLATIARLNNNREAYKTYANSYGRPKKEYWYEIIQLLPSSYNQKRTVTFSYETAVSMIKQRTGHKLDEWRDFVEILNKLPYVKEIME